MKKTTQFKRMLHSDQVEFLMEAHNGLSARIVEENGFKGIWGSGLSISASLGVRDSNEASWTQVLEVLEFMSDATSIPILLDGDTGYGNFNNVRRLVRKLEQRGIAAVCIEDKLFPKTNSFIGGEQQPLADIEEFSYKIKAAKDTQVDSDFCVIARVEALIAGWGLSEALRRAEAYHRAGADGILIHSKCSTPDQILDFMREWKNTCPVVIVPTAYFQTPTQVFEDEGVSIVIWANHLLRSSLSEMRRVAQRIQRDRSLVGVESEIASVKEVFRMQDDAELRAAEEKYLPRTWTTSAKAILLTSQRSTSSNVNGHGTLTARPDAKLLGRLVSQFNDAGIKEIIQVEEQGGDKPQVPGLTILQKSERAGTGEIAFLVTALEQVQGTVILARADTFYEKHILLNLQNEPGDVVVVRDVHKYVNYRLRNQVYYSNSTFSHDGVDFETDLSLAEDNWIGLCKLTPAGVRLVLDTIGALASSPLVGEMSISELLDYMEQQRAPISNAYISGYWKRIGEIELSPSVAVP